MKPKNNRCAAVFTYVAAAMLIAGVLNASAASATIAESSYSATPYWTYWCFRPEGPTPEDPWITYQSGNGNATMYAENSYSYSWGGGATAPVGGINVFIR